MKNIMENIKTKEGLQKAQRAFTNAKQSLAYIKQCAKDGLEAHYGEYSELCELMFTANANVGLTPKELVRVAEVAFNALEMHIYEPSLGLAPAPQQELVRCTWGITHAPGNVSLLKTGFVVLHQ